MFDKRLYFRHKLKSLRKILGQKISKHNRNWENNAVARTVNEVQSVIKKDNMKRMRNQQNEKMGNNRTR